MCDPKFGGDWTEKKLFVLESYLIAYTTALKKQSFKLIYIDAFAGSGRVEARRFEPGANGELKSFLEGSAVRAIRVMGEPFDELIFVEEDEAHYCQLKQRLESGYPERNLNFYNEDANEFLFRLERDWNSCRGVLFLDPFGTQVEFRTIQRVASFNALDTWILVPVSTISRLLPRDRDPSAISQEWAKRLSRIYGDESWKNLYTPSPQGELFGQRSQVRDPGIDGLLRIYKEKLKGVFGDRLLEKSLTLKNSRNSVLYELMFCCGSPSPNAIGVSKSIAKHLIREMQGNG